MTKYDFIECHSCKYMNTCPKSIIPGSVLCALYKNDQAIKELKKEIKKIKNSLIPKWLRRWLKI